MGQEFKEEEKMMNPRSFSTTIYITVKRDTRHSAPQDKFTVEKTVDELVPHYEGIEIANDWVALKIGISAAQINQRIDGDIQYPDSVHAAIYYEAVVKNDDAYQHWKKLLAEKGWL